VDATSAQARPATGGPADRTFADLISLTPDDHALDSFIGLSPSDPPRIYGGQMVAQSLLAAGATVPPGWAVHSLHTYFISPGDPREPLLLTVSRQRDGSGYRLRQVVIHQGGRLVAEVLASFHTAPRREAGRLDHGAPMPAVPDPETLPTALELLADPNVFVHGQYYRATDALDARRADPPPQRDHPRGEPLPSTTRVWVRWRENLGDDPLTHQIALAYISDTTLADSVMARYGIIRQLDGVANASLDHAVWFHRPARADDWMLYESDSPAGTGERGLVHGRLFSRDGAHIASTTQELLFRIPVGLGAPPRNESARDIARQDS
jgi:acyl-CoA thioesterase-2